MAESHSYHSRTYSKSPSPATSTTSAASQTAAKKRTRASKPKVRTGCITCKIRRVKCGEEKPSCVRCTSTGRTCDGYEQDPNNNRNQAPSSYGYSRIRPGSLQASELAKSEFLLACRWNEALRYMRPIAPGIDGTEAEKRFFHRILPIITAEIAAVHVGAVGDGGRIFSAFWNRAARQIGQQDEAVKHAVVALGAAYFMHFRCGPEGSQGELSLEGDGFTREGLDVFTIQQYNKSISKLQRHVGSSSAESVRVTLICCLAFVCLETLRANHGAAVTHLMNGLRILQTLPSATFDFLADRNGGRSPSPGGGSTSSFAMADIIRLFGRLEVGACFLPNGIRPVVAERGYSYRHLDDGAAEAPFASASDARRALSAFQRDMVAWTYSSTQPQPDPSSTCTSPDRQLACLHARAARLDHLLTPFLPPTTSLRLDLVYFRCAQLLLPSPAIDPHPLHLDILRLAAALHTSLPPPNPASHPRPISITASSRIEDTGLAGPLYLVALHTPSPALRTQALRLLVEDALGHSLGLSDGYPALLARAVGRLEGVVVSSSLGRRHGSGSGSGSGGPRWWGGREMMPRALTGLGCLPGGVYDALVDVVAAGMMGWEGEFELNGEIDLGLEELGWLGSVVL
ncbi:hypothetical protein B0T25DRAFT_518283 [Lasiosphaeria hispida]|uniref:Zn(2)-C6 fungal-type domain-containing protein n=1 Tax=Lasiosphaeria hispida TaxID=260671 RepID=A0AAJ0HI58_9PEZI|nr:hypothetical protein B0T25DRAFT_518283 [Lasiosphaeria hispida]